MLVKTTYGGPVRIVTRKTAVKPHNIGANGKIRFSVIPPQSTANAGRMLANYRWGYTQDGAQNINRRATRSTVAVQKKKKKGRAQKKR